MEIDKNKLLKRCRTEAIDKDTRERWFLLQQQGKYLWVAFEKAGITIFLTLRKEADLMKKEYIEIMRQNQQQTFSDEINEILFNLLH